MKLSLAEGYSRWSLRARDTGLLSEVTGLALPERIGDAIDGVAKLGPDEWYALLPEGRALSAGEGAAASVTDVSSRSVGLKLEGQAAAAALMSGCPLDLDHMAVGRATRTVLDTVEIVLFRESLTRFHIEVWRSFAPWVWECLAHNLNR